MINRIFALIFILVLVSASLFAGGKSELEVEDTEVSKISGTVTMSGGAYLMQSAQSVWDSGTMPEKYPDLKFVATGYPYLEYASKMKIAISAGEKDPDILVVHSRWIQDFLANDLVADVTEYVDRGNIVASALSHVTIDDRVYGWVYEIAPAVQYYRIDVLEEMGLSVPKTIDEYFDVGEKIAATGRYWDLIDPSGGTQVAAVEREFLGLLTQMGGDVFAADGTVVINSDIGIRAAELFKRLADADFTGHINAERPEGFSAVKDGRVVGNYTGYAWVHRMRDAVVEGDPTFGEWRIGSAPAWVPDGPMTGSETGTWIFINKLSDNLEAAIEVAKYFGQTIEGQTKLANDHVIIGGYKPALESLMDNSPSWPLLGNQGVQAKIAEIVLNTDVPIPQANPAFGESLDILRDYLVRMLNDQLSPAEAMNEAAAEIKRKAQLK
jgi:ABC-type glycerol-3-phosphate transport system substrate-binding protein